MTEKEFYISLRAAMIRRAKLLQDERATVLEEIRAIELRFGIEPHDRMRQVNVTDADSIASAAVERRV